MFERLIDAAGVRDADFVAMMERLRPDLPSHETYRDLEVGLESNLRHVERHVPEVLAGGLRVVDVGPGVGAFMIIARFCGNRVVGEECARCRPAYTEITDRLGLAVRRAGFYHLCAGGRYPIPESWSEAGLGLVDLFHLRGSLDAIMGSLGTRDPGIVARATTRTLEACGAVLAPGGGIRIFHNDDALRPAILAGVRAVGGLELVTDTEAVTWLRQP